MPIILISFLLVTIILPVTKARTAWVSAFASIIFILVYKYRVMQKLLVSRYKWIIMVSISIVLIFLLVQLYQYKKDSSLGRLFIWGLTLKTISENPAFGKGYNTFIYSHNIQQANYFKAHPDDMETGYL